MLQTGTLNGGAFMPYTLQTTFNSLPPLPSDGGNSAYSYSSNGTNYSPVSRGRWIVISGKALLVQASIVYVRSAQNPHQVATSFVQDVSSFTCNVRVLVNVKAD